MTASRAQQTYDTTSNLAALLQSTKVQADAGAAEALRHQAAAGDECLLDESMPHRAENFRTKHAAGLEEPQRSAALRHNDVQEQRCRDLLAQQKLTYDGVRESMARAAAAGDPLGLTMQLEAQWEDTNEQDLKESLRRIAASGDGEAIAAMATMLGIRDEEPTVNGPFAGTQEDYIAWLLVACDVGRDCSDSGRVMRNLCLVFGRCKPMGYREYIRTSLATPSQFDVASAKERTLLQLISNGRFHDIFP